MAQTARPVPVAGKPERAPIALVGSPELERTLAPLRAELGMLGFRMVFADLADSDNGLAGVGHRTGALAVIRVVAPLRAELWFSPSSIAGGPENQAVSGVDERALALRIVELLHARWAEIAPPEPDRAASAPAGPSHESDAGAQPPPSPPLPTPPRTATSQLWLGAAVGAVASSDGLGTQASGVISVTFQAPRLLELDIFGALPISSTRLSAPEGEATVRAWVFGLTLGPRLALGKWSLHFGGGPMLSLVQARGDARPPYESQRDSARVRGAQLRASVGVQLGSSFKLSAGARLGLGFEEARVVIAEHSAAQFGLPFVLADLGLAWGVL